MPGPCAARRTLPSLTGLRSLSSRSHSFGPLPSVGATPSALDGGSGAGSYRSNSGQLSSRIDESCEDPHSELLRVRRSSRESTFLTSTLMTNDDEAMSDPGALEEALRGTGALEESDEQKLRRLIALSGAHRDTW